MNTEQFSVIGATGTWTRQGVIRVLRYDSGAATGGVTPTIRVRSAAGSKFDVELNPGRTVTLTEPANGIIINNISAGADIVGKITFGDGTVTDDAVVGSVALDVATIAQLKGLRATASYAQNTAAAAGLQTLVAPGANVNGLWVTQAMLQCYSNVASTGVALLAKAGVVPASTADGDVLLFAGSTVANYVQPVTLPAPAFVAAGMGLYTYNAIADSAAAAPIRAARWLLL